MKELQFYYIAEFLSVLVSYLFLTVYFVCIFPYFSITLLLWTLDILSLLFKEPCHRPQVLILIVWSYYITLFLCIIRGRCNSRNPGGSYVIFPVRFYLKAKLLYEIVCPSLTHSLIVFFCSPYVFQNDFNTLTISFDYNFATMDILSMQFVHLFSLI